MIEYINEISNENGYKRYNQYSISDSFKELIFDDYYVYNTKEYNKKELAEKLYNKNFVNKYNKDTQKEIFDLYINNEKFKEKVLFIYSIIDEEKYTQFVQKNPNIQNPNDYTITYNIVDSDGVNVNMYQLSLSDIAFVF
ncbi:hypothetical protein [Malaciobacter mytili]|uniref:hypothetical protein n=1 Tax=Malaciobacter mytili TaxID=603050 RepID=UPI003A8A72F4